MGNRHYQLKCIDTENSYKEFNLSKGFDNQKSFDKQIIGYETTTNDLENNNNVSTTHKKRIVVSAGGTGGHIIPALSVCKALLREKADVFYIGNEKSMEADIITKNKIPFYAINVQKLYRNFTLKHLLFPFKLIKSIAKCVKYLRSIKPDAFIGFGGFVAGPPAIAAWLCRIPIYLQEQNCKPGLTNIWTGRFATAVFLAYEESKKYFKNARVFVTGNPVLTAENALKSKKTYIASKKLLILGGSQGSKFINNLILEHLEWFKENNIELIWQTGTKHLDAIQEKTSNFKTPITIFSFTDSLRQFYAQADYVISRGGALTLAEIEIHQIPAFVIPLSTAAVNEQYHNAKNMQNRNMGVMFEEKDRELFIDNFMTFIKNANKMYQGSGKSIHLTAAKNIADVLLNKCGSRNE